MARNRRTNTFSLSFLDIMSCGFGAVVLVYLILNHQSEVRNEVVNQDLAAEVDQLETEIRDARERLLALRNTIAELSERDAEVRGESERVTLALDRAREALAELETEARARQESVEALRADLAQLEEQAFRAQGRSAEDDFGADVRAFRGEGRRQYLTGLRMDGDRVLVLLDRSASMLDETLVNVIRRRNLDAQARKRADKWRRSVATVDWLTTQLPIDGSFQIYTFATDVTPAVPDTLGQWLDVASPALEASVQALGSIAPAQGTSLAHAFRSIGSLSPPPDNVFLITDGLPTQGLDPPRGGFVDGRERRRLFFDALDELPGGIPLNVILMPMEGDPYAAASFWELAHLTEGALMSPSRDWP